jgi:hypothetical protein
MSNKGERKMLFLPPQNFNFDLFEKTRSPTTPADTVGESGVSPLDLSSIEPYIMPTIPPYHRMVGLIVTKPAVAQAESRLLTLM